MCDGLVGDETRFAVELGRSGGGGYQGGAGLKVGGGRLGRRGLELRVVRAEGAARGRGVVLGADARGGALEDGLDGGPCVDEGHGGGGAPRGAVVLDRVELEALCRGGRRLERRRGRLLC